MTPSHDGKFPQTQVKHESLSGVAEKSKGLAKMLLIHRGEKNNQ
jgi:hypothetical protein